MKGLHNGALALVLAVVLGGCGQPTRHLDRSLARPQPVPCPDHRQVYERTRWVFAQAALISPASDGSADLPLWMAPLLVQELGLEPAGPAPLVGFGAVTVGATGRAEVDTNQMIVYLLSDSVVLGGRDFQQLTFLWYYPPAVPGQAFRYRGLRMVLDDRGFGILWEVLSSEDRRRIFYVGEPVEGAAAKAFGRPFPGRQFCVEPEPGREPEVLVARLLAEGPQPMGPFVYLDHRALSVTTLLCRCMPSQVDKIERRASYRLVRLANLEDLCAGGGVPSNLPLPPPRASWEGVLRLPPAFRIGP